LPGPVFTMIRPRRISAMPRRGGLILLEAALACTLRFGGDRSETTNSLEDVLSDSGQSSPGVDKRGLGARSGPLQFLKHLDRLLHGRRVAVTSSSGGAGFPLDVGGATGSPPGDLCPLRLSRNANSTGCGAVCIAGERVSGMTKEYLQVTDADIKMRVRNFSTELSHLKLRSTVRRISVPSQIAEVSS